MIDYKDIPKAKFKFGQPVKVTYKTADNNREIISSIFGEISGIIVNMEQANDNYGVKYNYKYLIVNDLWHQNSEGWHNEDTLEEIE